MHLNIKYISHGIHFQLDLALSCLQSSILRDSNKHLEKVNNS